MSPTSSPAEANLRGLAAIPGRMSQGRSHLGRLFACTRSFVRDRNKAGPTSSASHVTFSASSAFAANTLCTWAYRTARFLLRQLICGVAATIRPFNILLTKTVLVFGTETRGPMDQQRCAKRCS